MALSVVRAKDDLSGETLAHFRIQAPVGAGGVGVVYRAVDTRDGRTVALKVLAPHVVEDESRRRRFLREARLAAAIVHPNVVTVYESGESEGKVFIAMELIAGEPLRAYLARGPIALADALTFAVHIARGVARAHEMGVVHRDLKPENLMISEARSVKILDFGLAKLHEAQGSLLYDEQTASNITVEGRLTGTPGYMAPEQVTGKGVSFRADVFAFGVIFYEMLTGERPFRGESMMDVLIATTRDEPPPAAERNARVTPEMGRILTRCLAKRRGERFASARELLRELEPLVVLAPEVETLLDVAERTSSPEPVPVRPQRRWRAAAAAASVVITAAFALALRWGSSAPSHAPPHIPERTARSTTLLDLPTPLSDKPEALAAYADGMHALHDGSWIVARAAFARAAEADPRLAAAHLRLAMMSSGSAVAEKRAWSQKASQYRARLGERDQALLHALEPILQRTPAEYAEATARLRTAIERHPGDAELHYWLGKTQRGDPAGALPAFVRATELDAQFADAWEGQGRALAWLGRVDEARQVFETCAKLPAAVDCFYWLTGMDAAAGDCVKCEQDARRQIDRDPTGPVGHHNLADAFIALGRPDEGVRAAIEQSLQRWDAPHRERVRLSHDADLAIVRGDFLRAREIARQELALIASDPEGDRHLHPAKMLIRIALEGGDEAVAGDLAAAYVRRASAWATTEESFDSGADEYPWVLQVARRAGALSGADFEVARRAWVETRVHAVRLMPGYVWTLGYAQPAWSPEEAREALAKLRELGPLPKFFPSLENSDLHVGRVHALVGQVAEAEPYLERAARRCVRLDAPFAHAHAELELGLVREQRGNVPGACEAYRSVLAQWGKATLRSVTAERARARLRAIGCGE